MPKKPKPGGSVFEPRARMERPGSFGKTSLPLDPAGEADAQFEAAQFQHLIANKVRECVLAKHGSLRAFVDSNDGEPTMTYDRVSRIQRGETMMTLTDLVAWSKQFDEVGVLAGELLGEN